MNQIKILLSGGSYKFHMAPLAVELEKKDLLAGYITAGWPKGVQRYVACLFGTKSAKRFLDRYEPISNRLVFSIPISELILKLGDILFRRWSKNFQQKMHTFALALYANCAINILKDKQPIIYHYRNCYGLSSVDWCLRNNIITICDHSIAHPLVLEWMENNRGQWPKKDNSDVLNISLPLYKKMYQDIDAAEYLLVNSDFVKETCIWAGRNSNTIYVVYLGVDDNFIDALDVSKNWNTVSENKILFAGGWQRRKGIETFVNALEKCESSFSLEIAGGVEHEALLVPKIRDFLTAKNVEYLGMLPRNELACLMAKHRIFVFPSYCEGSARVIFEAMAAGCYIITTKNSGSIVEDGIHGRLVDPGDEVGLAKAIDEAISNINMVDEIGLSNRKEILEKYRQRDYGKRVVDVYENIIKTQILNG